MLFSLFDAFQCIPVSRFWPPRPILAKDKILLEGFYLLFRFATILLIDLFVIAGPYLKIVAVKELSKIFLRLSFFGTRHF